MTRPHATVEVEISEDMQLVHFDFNSTPFELHDDAYVLKAMRFCERQREDDSHEPMQLDGEGSSSLTQSQNHSARPSTAGNLPSSPPVPGILKGRAKHEH